MTFFDQNQRLWRSLPQRNCKNPHFFEKRKAMPFLTPTKMAKYRNFSTKTKGYSLPYTKQNRKQLRFFGLLRFPRV